MFCVIVLCILFIGIVLFLLLFLDDWLFDVFIEVDCVWICLLDWVVVLLFLIIDIKFFLVIWFLNLLFIICDKLMLCFEVSLNIIGE